MAPEDFGFTDVLEARCDGALVVTGRLAANDRTLRTRPEIEIAFPGERASAEVVYVNADGEEQRRSLTDKHVAIIPAGQPHRVAWRRTADVTVLLLTTRFVTEVARRLGIVQFHLVEDYAALDPVVWHLGREVRNELRRHGRLEGKYVEAAATILARHLVNTYAGSPSSQHDPNGLTRYKLRHAIEFIQANLHRDISFHDVAAHLKISPYHFARMFKRSTGDSPHRYLVRRRVERAKELLTETRLPITEIAFEVGYTTQSHFTTCFGRIAGVSPGAFRAGR